MGTIYLQGKDNTHSGGSRNNHNKTENSNKGVQINDCDLGRTWIEKGRNSMQSPAGSVA